ncbi:MAG: hypothetical protein K0M78_04125 [Brevundimonas sp.]|nr:hypothetical protein [Brevundimonas sp.]
MILGALGAAVLGSLTALQFDRLIAVGEQLLNPVGQEAFFRTVAAAGLTGSLCWGICVLVTRAIGRAALKPYDALADHLERLADGDIDTPIDLRGPVAGVRRLARAVVVFQQRTIASQRSEADLQARYDSLYQEHAGERRLLMGMLMGKRLDSESDASIQRPAEAVAPAEFEIPEPPSAAPEAVGGPPPHTGHIVDLAGRMKASARRVEEGPTGKSVVPDAMPLDFAFISR